MGVATPELLSYLRDVAPTWESVGRILASLSADPGRQGQRIIRHKHVKGWECTHADCGHQMAEDEGKIPTSCSACGYWRLTPVEMTVCYLAEGASNAVSDPMAACNFKVDFYRWVNGNYGTEAQEIVHQVLYGGWTQREAAKLIRVSQSRVCRVLADVSEGYGGE